MKSVLFQSKHCKSSRVRHKNLPAGRLISIAAFLLAFLLAMSPSGATNIQIDDVKIVQRNDAEKYAVIEFDLSWNDSFRTNLADPARDNWDAAWVFIKWIETEDAAPGNAWNHGMLRQDGHETSAGFTYTLGRVDENDDWHADTNPYVGAFIFRSHTNTGYGNVDSETVRLSWDYGQAGLEPTDQVNIKVFGIEMVYVAPGPFFVGDGVQDDIAGQFHSGYNNTQPYVVISEDEITLGGFHPDNLGNNNAESMHTADDFDRLNEKTLPAPFPKGYKSYYVMKHSVTQGAYVDFLNTLSATQASARYISTTSDRHNIVIDNEVYVTGHRHVPKNQVSWMDAAAYLDWAGLRPMSELEYEKAARGPLAPVAGEFAWGNTTFTAATGITNTAEAGEVASNADANVAFGNHTGGPIRVGAFAKASTNRAEAGASYWGIKELSGNLWEQLVSVGHSDGRAFTALHGNGTLSSGGNATIASWPGFAGSEVTGAAGSGLRGGHWQQTEEYQIELSNRERAAAPQSSRTGTAGFRGARSASGLVVNTKVLSNVTTESAESGGIVHDDGGFSVIARGVVWNTSPNPTITTNIGVTTDGTGTGEFTSDLTDLAQYETYYLRAYATNELGTAYGNQRVFNLAQEPTVETLPYTFIDMSSVTLRGLVNPNHLLTDVVFEWGSADPWDDEITATPAEINGGNFELISAVLSDLDPQVTYQYRVVATNDEGISYGEWLEIDWWCGQPIVDPRDGQEYNTVLIGEQCWLAEDLKYLPSVVGPGTGSTTTPYYYVYDYNGTSVSAAKATANFANYGVLYNWPAVMQTGANAICPAGWRVPSDGDWKQLEIYLGMTQAQADATGWRGTDQGRKLKSERTAIGSPIVGIPTNDHPRWNYHASNFGTDDYGFNALPGGRRRTNGSFNDLGSYGIWWSATESGSNAWVRFLSSSNAGVYRFAHYKANGFSVRCVRDE